MKTSSAKNKGRKLQQYVVRKLIEFLGIDPQDVESRSMGAGGEDIILSKEARRLFPFSVECKNTERLNLWESYKQASANADYGEPLLIIKRNQHKPLAVLDFDYLLELLQKDAMVKLDPDDAARRNGL